MNEWEEGRIEVSVVNAANLPRLHVGSMHAIQVVDRETCTAVVLPGASQDEAERLLRMIVDGNPGGEMTSQNPTTDDTVTSQNGHCEHCLTGCPYTVGGDGQCHPIRHLSAYGDMWPDGGCDICALIAEAVKAERERIVVWLRTHPSIAAYRLTDEEYPSPETLADMIERGERMEEK